MREIKKRITIKENKAIKKRNQSFQQRELKEESMKNRKKTKNKSNTVTNKEKLALIPC